MGLMIYANIPPKPPAPIEVSGRIIAVQDSPWRTQYTTIQPTDGCAVRVRGVWGAPNDQVRVRAREAQ